MPRSLFPSLLAGLACLASGVAWLGACASDRAHYGERLYHDERYIEAAAVFERTEPELAALGRTDRARYAMYRGMTLLKLGDLERARRWLAHATEIERAERLLTPMERTSLVLAWQELATSAREAGDDPGMEETQARSLESSSPRAVD